MIGTRSLWQVVLGAHLTTDENWALMLSTRASGRAAGFWYLVGAGVTLISVWVVATVTGVYFAAAIPEPKALGMDFAFTAAFIAIARSLWKGRPDLIPWVTSFAVVALCLWTELLDPSWALVLGGLSGSAIAGAQHRLASAKWRRGSILAMEAQSSFVLEQPKGRNLTTRLK